MAAMVARERRSAAIYDLTPFVVSGMSGLGRHAHVAADACV